MGLMGASQAEGVTMDVGFLHSAVSGMTEVRGAPAIVLEVMMDADVINSPGELPINLRIVTSEIYEIDRFVRLGYSSHTWAQFGLEVQTDTQLQDCFLRHP